MKKIFATFYICLYLFSYVYMLFHSTKYILSKIQLLIFVTTFVKYISDKPICKLSILHLTNYKLKLLYILHIFCLHTIKKMIIIRNYKMANDFLMRIQMIPKLNIFQIKIEHSY